MKNTRQKAAIIASNWDRIVDSGVCNQSIVFSFIHEQSYYNPRFLRKIQLVYGEYLTIIKNYKEKLSVPRLHTAALTESYTAFTPKVKLS